MNSVVNGGDVLPGRQRLERHLNVHTNVLDPDPGAPCVEIAGSFQAGDIRDYDTVLAFGRTVDLLTIEIENVSIEALKQLEAEGVKVYPQPAIVEIIKDNPLGLFLVDVDVQEIKS